MIEIALYQPDIAPNAATIARLCACFGLKMTIIEPAGFVWTDSSFRRAGMDYLQHVNLQRSTSWESFKVEAGTQRIILLSTKAALTHIEFQFIKGDILLLGRESAGVPDQVHEELSHRVRVPMIENMRSLNVAVTAGIVAAEALRQLSGFETLI
jgi:tRNA (cytidine/uridine-2'-O-)-methyltransferase